MLARLPVEDVGRPLEPRSRRCQLSRTVILGTLMSEACKLKRPDQANQIPEENGRLTPPFAARLGNTCITSNPVLGASS